MSKYSTGSTKTPRQCSSQSAWAMAPPNSSAPSPFPQPSDSSHAPSPITVSRSSRPSTLSHGVPIKEGVSVPRGNVGPVRQGSAVTFGSIDEISHPLSDSSALVPVAKTESVKSFGSVPSIPSTHVSGKYFASVSTPGSSKRSTPPASSSISTATSSHPSHTSQAPSSHAYQPSGSISIPSSPLTPSTTSGTSVLALNTKASTFVTTSHASDAIVIQDEDAVEVGLEEPKEYNSQPPNVTLRTDTFSMAPPLVTAEQFSGPLDIGVAERDMSTPLSTLATARNIKRLQDIEYPEGVRSPRVDLNKDAKDGKFRYDRGFLMQFMQLCKERPPNLPPLDALGIEPVDPFAISRGGSRHRQVSNTGPPAARQQSTVGLGISGGFNAKPGAAPGPFPMGQFFTPTKLTSEERFMISAGVRSTSVSAGPAVMQLRPPMTQTIPQGGPGGHPMGNKRVRSKRKRYKHTNANVGQGGSPEPPQLEKLQLLPRMGPILAEETPLLPSENESEAPVQM